MSSKLRFEKIHTYAAPRRLALLVEALVARQTDMTVRVKDSPTFFVSQACPILVYQKKQIKTATCGQWDIGTTWDMMFLSHFDKMGHWDTPLGKLTDGGHGGD